MAGDPSADALPEPLAGLVRDHERVDEVVGDVRVAFDRAALYGLDAERSAALLQAARDLDRFLAHDLTVHIAKEEAALFPALRGLARDTARTVDEMIVQHDEIRARQGLIDRTMAALDAHHGEIDDERRAISAGVHEATGMMSHETLTTLRDAVTRLHWILQGHFGDEEDDLFAPAAQLLAPATFEALAEQMAAIERAASPTSEEHP